MSPPIFRVSSWYMQGHGSRFVKMENHNNHGMEITSFEGNHLNGHPLITEISAQHSQPVPVFNAAEISDTPCIAEPYVHSDLPVISQVFKDIFEQRIAAIENDDNLDANIKNQEKLAVLQQHNKELQDQNDTFVSTLLELEQEAQQRVKQMEKRLKSSAKTTMEAVINVHDCAKEMRKIVEERIYVESLYNDMQQHVSNIKEENAFLRDQNCNLNHDIQALLQVIQHARSTGHWEMNCVTFCEVTPEQVFGPVQSISNLCTTDSPPLDLQSENERKISSNSSQEVIDSSTSSSCIVHCDGNQLIDEKSSSFFQGYDSHEVNNKDKRIAFLESQLSELGQRLTLKDAECECHLWKLEMLMQQNRNRMHLLPSDLQCSGTSLLKCISLPEIGNIYSFAHVSRKSHSCGIFNNTRTIYVKKTKRQSVKCVNSRCDDACEFHRCAPVIKKSDHASYNNRGQSEPHLFMYGDNIYVYKPCEPIKKISTVALHDDYETSLPPCQSIDLKFPTEGSNNKISDWTTLSKSGSHSIPHCSYYKDESSCSCTSSDPDIESDDRIICSKIEIEKKNCSQSSSVQTDEIVKFSVSLQAAIRRDEESSCMCSCSDPGVHSFDEKTVQALLGKDLSIPNDIVSQADNISADTEDKIKEKGIKRDFHQMINIMQTMKENLVKAEDKAAAKEILLAQLQGHLTSAVKEVELKDTALNNLEKKLDLSRNESTDLKNQISQMLKDLDDLQMLNDNLLLKVNAKEEKIQEMSLEQKVLQDQKRTLLTQLDAQGDELDKTKQLVAMRHNAESCALQVEQQTQIIRNLQEALVQSKRAFDASHRKPPLLWEVSSSHFENEPKSSSKSSIVDI